MSRWACQEHGHLSLDRGNNPILKIYVEVGVAKIVII